MGCDIFSSLYLAIPVLSKKQRSKLTAGETLNIIKPGILNSDAGPDFAQTKIKIDSIDWVGNAEIHVKASEWYDHKHDRDSAYENVVLHVVWGGVQACVPNGWNKNSNAGA
ncbi:MAG: DUF2851 family protein [Cytophagales bacterium]|nr:DUF2851 family protein [Cytophagales bacterium]